MNTAVYGLRVVHGTVNYFITDASQALPQHRDDVVKAFKQAPKSDKRELHRGADGLVITACRTYPEIAKWVVLQDVLPQEFNLGIFATKWTPGVPRPLEQDHLGRSRFKVLDFAEDEVEAHHIVNILRNQLEK